MERNIIVETLTKIADGDSPHFPSIGHQLYLADFLGEDEFVKLKYNDNDHFIVKDIIWSKSEGYPKVDLFIEKQ